MASRQDGKFFKPREPESDVADASISMGLNIYRYSRKIAASSKTTEKPACSNGIRTSYGFYQGGDVSTGGGDLVSLDPWLANPELKKRYSSR